MVVACVSTYDDADVLRGCLESVVACGLQALVVDGAYELYSEGEADVSTPRPALAEATRGLRGVTVVHNSGLWDSEAAKKTSMIRMRCTRYEPGWSLVLDSDERLETGAGPEAARAWLAELGDIDFAMVNLYRPDLPHATVGVDLPRLLNTTRALEFRPPMDYDVWRDGARVCSPNVESRGATRAPVDLLRIRHDRHVRSAARLARAGRYCVRRREVYGCG